MAPKLDLFLATSLFFVFDLLFVADYPVQLEDTDEGAATRFCFASQVSSWRSLGAPVAVAVLRRSGTRCPAAAEEWPGEVSEENTG